MELKNIKEIIIKTKDNELICSITEDNVIENEDYVIEYISNDEN